MTVHSPGRRFVRRGWHIPEERWAWLPDLPRPSFLRDVPPTSCRRAFRTLLIVMTVAIVGCRPAPPEFPLNMEGRTADSVTAQQAKEVQRLLADLFGTPDEPKVPEGLRTDLNLDWLHMAAGPMGGDAEGNQHGLFRRHCIACHGIAGDGAGPAAQLLDPYPRDYRNGTFKYTSTSNGAKPVREDLRLTLARGIQGTAMPSFAQLRDTETEALLEYVKYLSIRGETELYLLHAVVDDDASLPLDTEEVIADGVLPAVHAWSRAEREGLVIRPAHPADLDASPLLAASIERGRKFYLSANAQCVKCHGPEGDGRGEQTPLFDDWNDWNKRKAGQPVSDADELAALFTLPRHPLHPRDFRQGIFHGGSRPEDLYLRIAVGIKGTPMPAAGRQREADGRYKNLVFEPAEIWDIVNYVRSLSREGVRSRP
jgi:mono/diheme cytochrome c family protein